MQKKEMKMQSLLKNQAYRMGLLLLVVLLLGTVIRPGIFLTVRNFQSIAKQLTEYGILALAVFICMVSGGIDLSVVYIANLCAIVSGNILISRIQGSAADGLWILAVILLSLLLGCLCGWINGMLISRLHVPPMLATLGNGQLILGINTVLTKGKALTGIPAAFTKGAMIKIAGIPMVFLIFLLCAVCLGILMSRTRFGLRVMLIGTSQKAAIFSGIDYVKDICTVYAISGTLAAVSGLISLMKASSAKADYGVSYVLFSILICVFGGTSPNGGKGSVLAVTIATVTLQMISTLTSMFNSINSFYRDVFWGILLILVLIFNYYQDEK